jgi:hypothetical protein
MEVTGIKRNGEYKAAVHIQWALGNTDSLPVKEFKILKKRPADSAFSEMNYGSGIPDSVFDNYDVIDAKDLPQEQLFGNPFTCVRYRIFSIDTLDRPGDTSVVDSILLTWTPTTVYPIDTLKDNIFRWWTRGYQGGYFSYMVLWSEANGLLWTSPKPPEPTYGTVIEDTFSVKLPSTLYPLNSGKYYYGVKVEIPGVTIETIIIREFYAP